MFFNSRLRLLAASVLLLGGLGGTHIMARAADGPGNVQTIYSSGQMYTGAAACDSSSSRGCDVKPHTVNAQQASSFSVNKLVRENFRVENLYWQYTVPPLQPESGGNQGTYTVTGAYNCQTNASWSFQKTGGSYCWGAHTLQSAPNCRGDRNTSNFSTQEPGGRISAGNGCPSGVCVVDYQAATDPHFITANTGDNMIAMLPPSSGAKGFVVNNYCGSVPYWIERQGGEGADKYLMIPTKCQDYQSFVVEKPTSVKIEGACHPATLSMCPSPPSRPAMPPHPGCGGYAHGQSWCSGGYQTVCTTASGPRGNRFASNYQSNNLLIKIADSIYPEHDGDGGGVTTCTEVCQGWSYCDCGTVR